jgi:hypothetical protein
MHHKMLEEATPEQLKSFLSEQFDRLKRIMPELYEDMEEDLYEHIYGHHFTAWKYDCAASKFENQDGTTGPHWSVEDVTSVAKTRNIEFTRYNEYDFAYVINMIYSDYYGSVTDNVESYLKIAKAFLEDKDAPEGKAYRYYKAMNV